MTVEESYALSIIVGSLVGVVDVGDRVGRRDGVGESIGACLKQWKVG